MNYDRVEQLVDFWVDHYHTKAERVAGHMPKIQATKSYRKSKTAGIAHVGEIRRLGKYRITINIPLFAYHNDEYEIQNTVGHEIAHLVAYAKYNDRGHGRAWKWTMVQFGLDPIRCHSMHDAAIAVGKKSKNTTVYVYQCRRCGSHVTMGAKRHNKQQNITLHRGAEHGLRHRCGGRKTGAVQFIVQTDKQTFLKFRNGDIDRLPVGRQDRPRDKMPVDKMIGVTGTRTTAESRQPAHRRDPIDRRKNGPSKLDHARTIYRKMAIDGGRSRKEVITAIVNQAGCTQAGAATYYAKIKKEYS